jgi:transcription elongation factor Elf1
VKGELGKTAEERRTRYHCPECGEMSEFDPVMRTLHCGNCRLTFRIDVFLADFTEIRI